MTTKYYLYKKPDGFPDVSDHELLLPIFPGYRLMGVFENRPNVSGKVFDANDELIEYRTEPAYVEGRRYAYPRVADQLDMLWHAMDDGAMPKVEPFYSEILAVKQAYPKPSN